MKDYNLYYHLKGLNEDLMHCKLMFFDLKTNWIPISLNESPKIVQLSWIVADECGNAIKQQAFIIKPTDYDFIVEDATKVHGITIERARNEGVDINEALKAFISDISDCSAIIGHNIPLILTLLLKKELDRCRIENYLEKLPSYCTMRLSVDYCKFPVEKTESNTIRPSNSFYFPENQECNYIYPSLSQLYEFLFYNSINDANDVSSDVEALVMCFFELIKMDAITYLPTKRTYKDIEEFFHDLRDRQ